MNKFYDLNAMVDGIVELSKKSQDDGLESLENFLYFLVSSRRPDEAFRACKLLRERGSDLYEMACLYLVRAFAESGQIKQARQAAELAENCGPMNRVSELFGGFIKIAQITGDAQDIALARAKIDSLSDIEERAHSLLLLLSVIDKKYLTSQDVQGLRAAINWLTDENRHFEAWGRAYDLAQLTLDPTDLGLVCTTVEAILKSKESSIGKQVVLKSTCNLFRRWPDVRQARQVANYIGNLQLRQSVMSYLLAKRPGKPGSYN